MAPIGAKLGQNASQRIPDISFFDAEKQKKCKLGTAVYPPKMDPFGFKLWENAIQTIPDISFFDAKKLKTFFAKILNGHVYPPRMAPFGLKLWENAFQTICNMSFFNAVKHTLAICFQKVFDVKSIKGCFQGATMV